MNEGSSEEAMNFGIRERANLARDTLRIATYNVHGCIGTDRQRSEDRIAEVIAELSVDLIGLQELDLSRRRSAGVDQARVIAEGLGWNWHFQAAMRSGEEHYGHAVLSRYPLSVQRTACLPGMPSFFRRETRAAVGLEVATDFGLVHVIHTHLGLSRRNRALQAELLTSSEWLGSVELPLILLGDLNSLPGSGSHRIFSRRLHDVRRLAQPPRRCPTFPTSFPVLAVDHIFVNAALQVLSVSVHQSARARLASDHFPLVAELRVTGSRE